MPPWPSLFLDPNKSLQSVSTKFPLVQPSKLQRLYMLTTACTCPHGVTTSSYGDLCTETEHMKPANINILFACQVSFLHKTINNYTNIHPVLLYIYLSLESLTCMVQRNDVERSNTGATDCAQTQ